MELLGVVAIIGILSALIAVGVVAYNRSLKVMELNNTAEEIYIAAQNHLTALRTNATAEKALKDAGYGTRASDVSSAPADLTASDKAAQWNAIYAFGSTTGGTASGSGVSGSTAGVSGSTTGAGGETAGSNAQIAAYVMPAGAVDGTVTGEGNSYIIEYNPSAYTVYGVFYTDGKSSVLGRDTGETISVTKDLGKLNKEVKTDGTTKITSYQPQNESGTKGICVGYYGGSGAANLDSHKLNGSLKLKIVNGDRLYAELTTRDLALADESPAEQADDTYRIVLDVRGTTSGAEKSIGHTVEAGGQLDGEGSSWISLENPAIKGKTAVYKIVLDDITRQGTHFAEIFADGTTDNGVNFIPGENITVSANVFAVDKLSNIVYSDSSVTTNSLFGGLTSGSQSSGTTAAGASAAGTTTAGVNTAAASVTETVTISSFRHLENLSPRVSHVMRMTGSTDEDAANAVSLTTSGTGTNGAGTSGTGTNGSVSNSNTYSSRRFTFRAVLTSASGSGTSSAGGSDSASASSEKQTMSWSDFFKNTGHQAIDKKSNNNADDVITYVSADNSSNSSNNGSSKAGGSKSSSGTQNGSFSPVENPWLSEFNGGGMTIDGVYISADDSQAEARGLFGTIDQKCNLTIKNLKLQNFDITSSNEGFSDLLSGSGNSKSGSGTRKSGSGNPDMICAGMLAGRMYSKKYSVTVQNVIALEKNDNYCGVWCAGNETNVVRNGGLIGEIQTADDKEARITVKKCSASVYVKSSSGTVDIRTKEPGLRDVDIAGGLIGHVEGNSGRIVVENSYAGGHTENALKSPYYSSADKTRGKSAAGRNVSSYGIAGGLVGAVYATKDASISFSSDYSTASAACASGKSMVPYSDAGGLIGYVSKNIENISASDCYSTGLVEGDLKGGVAGYIALTYPAQEDTLKNFTNCRFLEAVSTGQKGGEIPAVNILERHADPDSGLAQIVKKYDKFSGCVYPADASSLTSGGGTAEAKPYDQHLQGVGKYPFISGQKIHYGDWPVLQVKQSFKGDFGILYYEIVQHGTDKRDRDYYYHGFVGSLTSDGSKENYEEVNTLHTNAQACDGRPYSDHALLTGHDEYVVEEGYLILSSKEYQKKLDTFNDEHENKQNQENSESITVEIGNNDGNNSDLTIAKKIKDYKMQEYDAFLAGANIVGYHAYAINSDMYTSEAGKSVSLMIRDQKFNNGNNGKRVAYSEFYFQPVFSDTLSKDDPGNFDTYSIRSAKQLKLMFENGGNTTIDAIQNGKETLTQTLDISYDPDKVKFTELAFNGTADGVRNSEKQAYVSPCFSWNFNTTYDSSTPRDQTSKASTVQPGAESAEMHYKLDGLNQPFITTLGSRGCLNNIRVMDVKADNHVKYFIQSIVSDGKLLNTVFEDCSFTVGMVGTNSGVISGNKLDHCGGNSFVSENKEDSANIKNITITNSNFSGAVIGSNSNNAHIDNISADTLHTPCFVNKNTLNNSVISNVHVVNAHFYDAKGAFINENDACVKNCSVDYADFEGFGFVNVNQNKGTISDCQIRDAVIELADDQYGGGFVCTNTGTIENCQIYSRGFDQYQNDYLKKYDSASVLFHPLHFSADDKGGLQAESPKSAYDLVVTGVKGDFSDRGSDFRADTGKIASDGTITEGIGGFAWRNSENGTILNCSFTGSVFGSIASGFIYSNEKKLTDSYANAFTCGTRYSCGFMYANAKGNTDMNHALGQILGTGYGSGFLGENSGAVSNSYTAVWYEEVKRYYPFYITGNGGFNNNYAVKDLLSGTNDDTDPGKMADQNTGIKLITDDQLRGYADDQTMSALGGPPENGTSAYAKALDGMTYPYPMPHVEEKSNGTTVNKTLIAYGDWRTSGGLVLNPSEIDLYPGETYDLKKLKVTFNDQQVSMDQLKWELSGGEDSCVSLRNQVLTGNKPGRGTVMVSYTDDQGQDGDITCTAQLTVNVLPRSMQIQRTENGSGTDITKTEQKGYVGTTLTLSAVLSPEDPDAEITWTSSDAKIASVGITDDGTATLTCLAKGDTTITAEVHDKGEQTKDNPEAYPPAAFTLHVINKSLQVYYEGKPVPEDGITLTAGQCVSLTAVTIPDNKQTAGVTWTSSDAAVASVNAATGVVTAGQAGTATITASAEGLDPGTCEIHVVQQNLIAGKINASGMKIHSVAEYTAKQYGCNISPGTLIADNTGNYCLVYSNSNWYQITQQTVQDIVQTNSGNIELINEDTKVVEVGQDRKIPNPCAAGTILHYNNNGRDEYYVLKQPTNWETTIDKTEVIARIGVQ